MASRADRHRLYELSVQCVEAEIDFVDETYRKLRGRRARLLREDFCGTGNSSCEWVRRRRDNEAYGVDLDAEVLAWGGANRVGALKPEQRERVHLLRGNVLHGGAPPVDVLLAMNFSYWIFKTRNDLRRYFRAARKNLRRDGLFILDFYGGSDTMKEMRERRAIKGGPGGSFTYIWDQNRYDPISGDLLCHIHFAFKDRSRLEKAFTYEWRLWTMPEVRELLEEAGFRKVTVYWEGTDEDGEGDGEYTPAQRGEADPAWISYVVAEK
ncbi:MAG: class I SAM-dependent methyltransferase [Phycisphaerales bacterium]|nr:class I SAM-dependent methyltransferase [Phycisphaerales bacterium]